MKKGNDKTRFQINNVVTTQMYHFLLRRHQLIKVTADQITENLTPERPPRFPITVVASINHQTRRRLSYTSRKRRVPHFVMRWVISLLRERCCALQLRAHAPTNHADQSLGFDSRKSIFRSANKS
jgi:hypothetical protein